MFEAMGEPKCAVCGCDDYDSLVFHHIVPADKEFDLSIDGYRKSWETICHELKKCVILCNSCHPVIHTRMRKGLEIPKFVSSFDERIAQSIQKSVDLSKYGRLHYCERCGVEIPANGCKFCPTCSAEYFEEQIVLRHIDTYTLIHNAISIGIEASGRMYHSCGETVRRELVRRGEPGNKRGLIEKYGRYY